MKYIKPRQLRFTPLTIFSVIGSGGTFIFPFWYFQQHGWNTDDLPAMLLMLLISWGSFLSLFIYDKRLRSIELTEEGILYLDIRLPSSNGQWSIWERKMLNWKDIKQVEIRINFIVLSGYKKCISINTSIFKDPNEVLKFINKSLHEQR